MVHYIRYLKIPQLHPAKSKGKNATVKALVTITTDLGDDFYADNLKLTATVALAGVGGRLNDPILVKDLTWQAGMRNLSVGFELEHKDSLGPLELCISCKNGGNAEVRLLPAHIPRIVSVWSEMSVVSKGGPASNMVERRFCLGNNTLLSIREEMGESIARHLWDAGLALVAYLGDTLHGKPTSDNQTPWITLSKLNVLELGSGCGVVGIALAQMVPCCNIWLTDLPEAMDILNHNVSEANPAHQSKLEITPLEWESSLPSIIEGQIFNLILVSDCTYNADSLPSLVQTLSILISCSPDSHIIVSMKVRHPGEKVFFDLMSKSGLGITKHAFITMPDDYRNTIGLELETVDVYTFRYQNF